MENKYIIRPIIEKLKAGFTDNRIIIILGSRQVGKTTAMRLFEETIEGSYAKFHFNLENVSDLKICSDIETLISYLKENGIDAKKDNIFLTIDEFQYIKNATKLFKQFYDLYPNVKILASGSSSIEIQKHLKESLAGRKRVYNLYSLSFDEFIKFKDLQKYQLYKKIDFRDATAITIDSLNKNFLDEYLTYGGYPKVALTKSKDNKIEELQDIYNSYIQKDIKSLIKGENISAYNDLLSVLASQIGNLLNINELTNTLNMKRKQIVENLEILEETFILKTIKPFSGNKRTEISKMPKIYFYDQGIANFATSNFGALAYRQNLGGIVENFVMNEIVRTIPIHYKLYFWRTKLGSEIDFILEGDGGIIPIEVKWKTMTKPIIPKSIISFTQKYDSANNAIVITKDFSATVKHGDVDYNFIPAVFTAKCIKNITNDSIAQRQ